MARFHGVCWVPSITTPAMTSAAATAEHRQALQIHRRSLPLVRNKNRMTPVAFNCSHSRGMSSTRSTQLSQAVFRLFPAFISSKSILKNWLKSERNVSINTQVHIPKHRRRFPTRLVNELLIFRESVERCINYNQPPRRHRVVQLLHHGSDGLGQRVTKLRTRLATTRKTDIATRTSCSVMGIFFLTVIHNPINKANTDRVENEPMISTVH